MSSFTYINKEALTPMKKNVFFLLLAGTMAACGPGEPTDLDKLMEQRDLLKVEKNEISSSLADVEKQIAEMDTNKRIASVTLFKTKLSKFRHFFNVHGAVETDQNARIFPETAGIILEIRVKEGDQVKEGEVLMVLDTEVLRKNLEEVKSNYKLANTLFQRQEKLWKQKIGSEVQYLQAKSNRDALKKRMEAIHSQIEMARVKAPFSGVVDEIYPKEGEMGGPQAPVARLINLRDVYIKSDVSERYLSRLESGDSVLVKFPSIEYDQYSTIQRTGKYINPDNRTFKIRVNLDNERQILMPNLLAEIEIMDYEKDSVVVIPTELVLQGAQDKEYVFVLNSKNGIYYTEKRTVSSVMSYQNQTMVEGLNPGELIVARGARSIIDGEMVEVKNNF